MLDWPPQLPQDKHQELLAIAMDWCATHGLIYRYPSAESNALLVHAPFALCRFG